MANNDYEQQAKNTGGISRPRTLIVGSRQSALALTQTGQIIELLEQICEQRQLPYTFEVRKIVTKGDRILDVTLSKVGGKGLFVKEIEQAMLDGEIDLAVHSMKDMPFAFPEGLMNGAVPKRVDPRDCLVTRGGLGFTELPQGARVGTSSLRRAAQLKALRPDLVIESIRGNIDSRIRKLDTEGLDAVVLAAAGIARMGWSDKVSDFLPADMCIPAVAQGALGIECRSDDHEVRALLAVLNDEESEWAVRAERAFLGALNGGCQIPLGAYAEIREQDGKPFLRMAGMVGSPDGSELLIERGEGNDPEQLGNAVAAALIAKGADRILAEIRG